MSEVPLYAMMRTVRTAWGQAWVRPPRDREAFACYVFSEVAFSRFPSQPPGASNDIKPFSTDRLMC